MTVAPLAVEPEQIVLTLPRAVVRRAEEIAARTRRSVETVLAE